MLTPAAKREAVAHLQAELGLSERPACSIVSADRKMIRYRSCRPPDTELRVQLRELANAAGASAAATSTWRAIRAELNLFIGGQGLSVRKRRARRRAVGTSP